MYTKAYNQPEKKGSLLQTLTDYWFIILMIVLGIPYAIRYYKNQAVNGIVNDVVQNEKEIVAQNQNPITAQKGMNAITPRTDLQLIARNTAFNLGTSVRTKEVGWLDPAFWDPTGWTENDEKAYNQLAKVNHKSSALLVIQLYYFQTRRDLKADIKKYLPDSYIKRLPLFA